MNGDPLPLAVRAYAEPIETERPRKRAATRQSAKREVDSARRPEAILVFDCETTVDASQALLFGVYRFYGLEWRTDGPRLTCLKEGLLYTDELAFDDPDGHQTLERFTRTHHSASVGAPRLRLCSRAEFVKKVLLPALAAQATVVTFNAAFDLSRIATGWGLARGKGFEGGFSFKLVTWEDEHGRVQENRFKPRLRIRPLDSKRAHIGLARVRPGADADTETRDRGSFLDLRTLAYNLSGEAHSLDSACQAFGIAFEKRQVEHGRIKPEYVDYCREDVAASASLYQALASEYERHGLQRAPTRVYSPAGLAKAYLAEAGIGSLLSRQPTFPKEVLGYAMTAYYGGRAECRIRRLPVPVSYLDFASMYPTCAALMGLWRFLTCKRVKVVEDGPGKVEAWLGRLNPGKVFDPRLWPKLCGLVLVEPRGDVLSVRARYSRGGSYGIGLNPLTSCGEPLWYTLPDALAATLQSGRPPKILRAIRFVPSGQTPGLKPLRIRGSRPIYPYTEDVFRALVEERRRYEQLGDPESLRTAAALKTVASAASYGISVELNRHEPHAEPVPVRVYGLSSFDSRASTLEEPGGYFFPPHGALVTGAARLMLALLEREVTDRGGSYAFCDTDSMAIVATRTGGLIPCPGGRHRSPDGHESVRALSWADIDGIVARFESLNPHDPAAMPGSILELEHENLDSATGERRELTCYAISAKRYALYTLTDVGAPVIVKRSEHALGGFYLDPTDPADQRDWVSESWQLILREDALGLPAQPPDWLDRPALTRFTASHPRLLHPFSQLNDGKPYPEQIKPANFLLVAHVPAGGHPPGADPERFALVAPFDPDPGTWQLLAWRNVYDPKGPTYRLTTETIYDRGGAPAGRRVVGVATYRDVLTAYRRHPEPKSLGADGRPCSRNTIGALTRRPVQVLSITHVGKEANLLEEIAAGLIRAEAESLLEYGGHAEVRAGSRSCDSCGARLFRRQRRWCPDCRKDHRLRIRHDTLGLHASSQASSVASSGVPR